jgi:hypothetical protein
LMSIVFLSLYFPLVHAKYVRLFVQYCFSLSFSYYNVRIVGLKPGGEPMNEDHIHEAFPMNEGNKNRRGGWATAVGEGGR